MVELAFAPRGALDGIANPGRHGREGAPGVVLAVSPACAQAMVLARRGRTDTLVETAAQRGIALPPPGQASLSRDLTLVATGPGQWLALAEEPADTAGQLFAAMASACTLVRVDDSRTLLTIGGPEARNALAKMLTIDLHPRGFQKGSAAVTVAGGLSVILWQTDEAPRYRLAVPRSTARSFWHWLTESAAEYGVAIAGVAGEVVAAPGRGG